MNGERHQENPLVSVVVPTRNRRAMLRRCLDALAAQTYGHFEVLVVDDCSSDGTPNELSDFQEEHPGLVFRWYRNEPQAGANPSRNRAIRESVGEYIAFLDDDCIAAPDWLGRLLEGFVSERVAAVTGRIDDPEPTNVYELAFKGTHRIDGRTHAVRLVGGNMCVRRELLLRHMLDEDRAMADVDTSISGRGDEEGLFLALRAAGYEQRVAGDAVVLHEHYYSRRSFFRQAYRGGRATARLAYKYRLPPRIELTPLFLAYVLLPLSVLGGWWWLASAVPTSFFLAAVLYNERYRKRKTVGEILHSFVVVLAFFHLRLMGYVVQHLRFLFRVDRLDRVEFQSSKSG